MNNTSMQSISSSIRSRATVGLTALALLAVTPAVVAGGAAVERPLKGGCNTTFVPAGPPTGGVQTLSITLTCRLTHLGLTGAAADQQVTFGDPGNPLLISTTITYVAANGDELHATFAGQGFPGPDGTVAFAGMTTYSGGTGRFEGATGWSLDTGTASLVTFTGALTANGKLTY